MADEGGGIGKTRKTPGVYVSELDAFAPSIVGVATAVPIFIGYTETARDPATGAALYGKPVPITLFADYVSCFGGPPPRRYSIVPATSRADFYADTTAPNADGGWDVTMEGYAVEPAEATDFLLHAQMLLYFANGGGNCFVVSAGSYETGQSPAAAPLLAGIEAAGGQAGATMIVVPEACQLDQADYAAVTAAMLGQAARLGDRMAILDLPGCRAAGDIDALEAAQANLWAALGVPSADLGYGAAYAPALGATVVQTGDLAFTNLSSADNSLVNNLLTTQAGELFSGLQLATIQTAIAAALPLPAGQPPQNNRQYSNDASGYPALSGDPQIWRDSLDDLLNNALPLLRQLLGLALTDANIQPPSGAIAGIWTQRDANAGVWTAPANVALASVAAVLCPMNDAEQAGFNVPLNGMAVDIIRLQMNRGLIVWGARTLDGNGSDYRYIQARRTVIYIEQSIRQAIRQFVFAPNGAETWAIVTATISAFLTQLWSQGGLQGGKPSTAFQVQCGLGSTMTNEDVGNGLMIVSVTVAITHPAEFIVLQITQQMSNTDN